MRVCAVRLELWFFGIRAKSGTIAVVLADVLDLGSTNNDFSRAAAGFRSLKRE